MNIIVTGAYGFIGSHLCFHLEKLEDINITRIGSKQNILDYQEDFKNASNNDHNNLKIIHLKLCLR